MPHEQDIRIVEVNESDKRKYMDLLLIADEEEAAIEKYLHRGRMFALYAEGGLKTVCIVTDEGNGVFEIKNIATVPEYQRMGYGKRLVLYLCKRYGSPGSIMQVGTGDSPKTFGFYHSCGFVRSHVVKDFFVNNYKFPMFDDGRQLIDMIYFKKAL